MYNAVSVSSLQVKFKRNMERTCIGGTLKIELTSISIGTRSVFHLHFYGWMIFLDGK